jgi:hypothetical protein
MYNKEYKRISSAIECTKWLYYVRHNEEGGMHVAYLVSSPLTRASGFKVGNNKTSLMV